MKTIHKYKLSPSEIGVYLPSEANILSAGTQNNEIYIWAEVPLYPTQKEMREIMVLGTGHNFNESINYRFLNTVFFKDFVFHIYEVLPNEIIKRIRLWKHKYRFTEQRR